MNSLVIAVLSFFGFIVAYHTYGKFISRKIFAIDPNRVTPANKYEDGLDHVPTKKHILFGHHFTTISGAGPIVGPAIAVIWGWLPALIWVIVGSIFMGAVHDFGAMVVSARNDGRTIGDITSDLIGPRAGKLFLILIFFALLIVIAVFGLVIALLFIKYPQSVLPVWIEMPIAMIVGYYIYKKSGSMLVSGAVALVLLYFFIYIGMLYPITLPAFVMGNPILSWMVVLLTYAYVASILPVWFLLQPRDVINSHQLFVGLGLLFLGLIIGSPQIVAPAINSHPEGAPSLLPFLFITIACGAISGFHSLVSSGTTVKQLDNESDMPLLGYGSMLTEGFLATMAILVCTAGFASVAEWESHYSSWSSAQGLGAKVGAFVEGGANFISFIGFSHEAGAAIVAVLVVSFCATTLDSSTRIQRYVIEELARSFKVKPLTTKHGATAFAVVTAFMLASVNEGKGGLIMWPLFGTVNQLLAGLALLVITIYLVREKKPVIYTTVPMLFILTVTAWAMVVNLNIFYSQGKWLLVSVGTLIFMLEIWLVAEAVIIVGKLNKGYLGTGEILEHPIDHGDADRDAPTHL